MSQRVEMQPGRRTCEAQTRRLGKLDERSPRDDGHSEKCGRAPRPGPGTKVRRPPSKAGVVFLSDPNWWMRGESIQAHTLPGSKPNAQGASQQDFAGTPTADQGATAMWETRVQSLGWEDSLEKEMATYSSILAWKIPWTEEPVGYTLHGVAKSWI